MGAPFCNRKRKVALLEDGKREGCWSSNQITNTVEFNVAVTNSLTLLGQGTLKRLKDQYKTTQGKCTMHVGILNDFDRLR